MQSSQKFSDRAARRIRAIAERDDLSTNDPLLAEISLAQVDATLAVAAALSEAHQRTNFVEVVNPYAFPSGSMGSDRPQAPDDSGAVTRAIMLQFQLAQAEKTIEELRRQAQPWWRRIFP